jgi:hypothetical protein
VDTGPGWGFGTCLGVGSGSGSGIGTWMGDGDVSRGVEGKFIERCIRIVLYALNVYLFVCMYNIYIYIW